MTASATVADVSVTSTVSTAFPSTKGRERGYHPAAVDTFLTKARACFENDDDSVTAEHVRKASFPLVKNGYVIKDVDAALSRVEDAFASRARERAIRAEGAASWVEKARGEAQVILDHLSRPRKHRFARTGVLGFGYRIDEVDHVADRIAAFLRDGKLLTPDQLRAAAFRMERRGYREEQVDALIDAAIEVMLAVR